jgi:small GTP-binding protein
MAPDDFVQGEAIGFGGFSTVYRGLLKSSGRPVAIKALNRPNPASEKYFARELSALWFHRHPTLLKCVGYVPFTNSLSYPPMLVTELMEHGSVAGYIQAERDGAVLPPEWTLTRKLIILYGVAVGLAFLHERGVVHRDVKPGNVLLDDDWEPIIADFGLARSASGNTSQFTDAGTRRTTAPEVLKGEKYTPAADVFSFGALAYVLITGRPFWPTSMTDFTIFSKEERGERPVIPATVKAQYSDLITECWSQKPRDRPTMQWIAATLSNYDFLSGEIHLAAFRAYQAKIRRLAPRRLSTSREELRLTLPNWKVIFLGDMAVGKTCLFAAIQGEEFTLHTRPTIQCDFVRVKTQLRDGTDGILNVYDTAGQECFRACTLQYFRGAACAILVFDLTSDGSFDSLRFWHKSLKDSEAKIVLVGTHSDNQDARAVSTNAADAYAREIGAVSYVEVSAKTGDNIAEMMDQVTMAASHSTVTVEMRLSLPEAAEQGTAQRKCC